MSRGHSSPCDHGPKLEAGVDVMFLCHRGNQIDNNPQGGMRGCLNSCLGAMGAIMCCRMMDDCFSPIGGFDEFGNPTSMDETDFGQDAFDIDF
ncbi:hypothetical protein TNCT_96991 [Trichonephila clavata]|uniref:Uncharacterized protein n=1 Tax=Trichonephila clavata TaxID=2740835 RepID=A0A8X6G3W0_TRICU|nr:hypothetical protein TNCT_96991 [Trichonephila clavata]